MSNWRPELLVVVKDAGQALAFGGAVQPDVGTAATDLVGGFGKQLAHVGQRGRGW